MTSDDIIGTLIFGDFWQLMTFKLTTDFLGINFTQITVPGSEIIYGALFYATVLHGVLA